MTLPDFGLATYLDDYTAYPAYAKPGQYWISPRRVALAPRADGLPDLHLTLVRARFPQIRTYGLLDLAIQAEYALTDAYAELSRQVTPLTVRPALPTTGYLRLDFGTNVLGQPLSWNNQSQSRMRLRLDADEASVLRQALEDGTLIAEAVAVLAISGMAVRAPATIAFDPQSLLQALVAARDESGHLPYTALEDFLIRHWTALPLRLQPTGAGPLPPLGEALGTALLDRLVAHYAVLAAPAAGTTLPCIELPEQVSAGTMLWRLDDELVAWRPLALHWRPLEVVREQIEQVGMTPFLTFTSPPALPVGAVEIDVVGNLPIDRSNVLSIGAHLTAPPRPPQRPQSAQATATLLPPQDTATATLRLGLKEPLAYEVRPFIVLGTTDNFIALEGTPRSAVDQTLELSVADYPVCFWSLTAEPGLRALASVTGELQWQDGTARYHVPVTLDNQHASIALAVPKTAVAPALYLTANALTDSATLAFPPLGLDDTYLTLWHLPGFGAHTIRFVAAQFAGGDVQLEAQPEDVPITTRLTLRSDHPAESWGYVALNPFHPGFRYRLLPHMDRSPILSPLEHQEVIL